MRRKLTEIQILELKKIQDEITELRNERNDFLFGFILVFVFLIFFGIVLINIVDNPREENELLKSQIPVWTLKVECNYDFEKYTHIWEFTNYNLYLRKLELIKEWKNCEMIK